MKILLVVNNKKEASRRLGCAIQAELLARQIDASFFSYTDRPLETLDHDAAFSLGGDGTVLFAARTVAAAGIPVLPLNLGTLGFIATVRPGEWQTVFSRWQAGEVAVSKRLMLEVTVVREDKQVFVFHCLNDAVISAQGIAKVIRLTATAPRLTEQPRGGGALPLGSYRSDGLIIATPTGSTAYCAASGGPILDPEMEAIVVNPICPFTLSHRPLVFPGQETIAVRVDRDQRSDVLLTIDGQVTRRLLEDDEVLVRGAPFKAALIAAGRSSFYAALQTKLPWSGGAANA